MPRSSYRTIYPSVILNVVKDLKKVERDAVEPGGDGAEGSVLG
jgi:hypothetical protein